MRRRLRDGVFVISTPNRNVYSAEGLHNPFHCSEMDEEEFSGLLRQEFRHLQMYSQSPQHASIFSLRAGARPGPSGDACEVFGASADGFAGHPRG